MSGVQAVSHVAYKKGDSLALTHPPTLHAVAREVIRADKAGSPSRLPKPREPSLGGTSLYAGWIALRTRMLPLVRFTARAPVTSPDKSRVGFSQPAVVGHATALVVGHATSGARGRPPCLQRLGTLTVVEDRRGQVTSAEPVRSLTDEQQRGEGRSCGGVCAGCAGVSRFPLHKCTQLYGQAEAWWLVDVTRRRPTRSMRNRCPCCHTPSFSWYGAHLPNPLSK
jgi:hypothetical protein